MSSLEQGPNYACHDSTHKLTSRLTLNKIQNLMVRQKHLIDLQYHRFEEIIIPASVSLEL